MNLDEQKQLRRENCRHEVRWHLYDQGQDIEQSVSTITRYLRRESDFTEDEIKAACLFWAGEKQFEEVRDPDGATRRYKITSKGVIEYERSLI